METMTPTETEELLKFRSEKNRLLKLNPDNLDVQQQAKNLVGAMGQFRLEHPEHAGTVMDWEEELLKGFPRVDFDGEQ